MHKREFFYKGDLLGNKEDNLWALRIVCSWNNLSQVKYHTTSFITQDFPILCTILAIPTEYQTLLKEKLASLHKTFEMTSLILMKSICDVNICRNTIYPLFIPIKRVLCFPFQIFLLCSFYYNVWIFGLMTNFLNILELNASKFRKFQKIWSRNNTDFKLHGSKSKLDSISRYPTWILLLRFFYCGWCILQDCQIKTFPFLGLHY